MAPGAASGSPYRASHAAAQGERTESIRCRISGLSATHSVLGVTAAGDDGQLGGESRSTKCFNFGACVRLERSDFHQRCIARIANIAVEVDDRRDELHKVVES